MAAPEMLQCHLLSQSQVLRRGIDKMRVRYLGLATTLEMPAPLALVCVGVQLLQQQADASSRQASAGSQRESAGRHPSDWRTESASRLQRSLLGPLQALLLPFTDRPVRRPLPSRAQPACIQAPGFGGYEVGSAETFWPMSCSGLSEESRSAVSAGVNKSREGSGQHSTGCGVDATTGKVESYADCVHDFSLLCLRCVCPSFFSHGEAALHIPSTQILCSSSKSPYLQKH